MPRKKQFDQADILKKAMERFWKRGFHATSMQDLVDHLGINRASIYSTFPGGKEQLFQEAFQLYQKEYGFDLDQVRETLKQKSVKDFLKDFFQQSISELESDTDRKGCFVTNTTCELSTQSEEVGRLLSNHMAHVVAFFAEIVRLGQERGEIANTYEADYLAKHIYTFFNGIKAVSKIEPDMASLQHAIEIELSFVFGG